MKKLTPIRLDVKDTEWVDEFVKVSSNPYESRSNFIRVAIKTLIKKEKADGCTQESIS